MFDFTNELNMPICIIQGDIDTDVDPKEAIKYKEKFPKVKLNLIKGAGHSLSVDGDYTLSQKYLIEFFSK